MGFFVMTPRQNGSQLLTLGLVPFPHFFEEIEKIKFHAMIKLILKVWLIIFWAHFRANTWALYRMMRTLEPHRVCVMKALDGSHCVWVEHGPAREAKYFLHLHGKRRGQHK